MSFNLDQWKDANLQNLRDWKSRMQKAGVNSAYYFLAGNTLLPIAQAVHSGDWSGLAVLGASLGGTVGTNLLANIVQKTKDKSAAEVAQILESEVKAAPELKAAIDAMLEKMNTLQEAEKILPKADQVWFADTILRELKSLKSSIKYETRLIGEGAVAQGDGALAIGKGAIIVGGNISGSNIVVGNAPRSDVEALSVYCRELVESSSSLTLRGVDIGATDPSYGGTAISIEDVYVDLNTTTLDEEDKEN